MKISSKSIVVSILGVYILVNAPYVLLSIFINISNIVYSLATNTPSFYGDLLSNFSWWIAILYAEVGVILIKYSRRFFLNRKKKG